MSDNLTFVDFGNMTIATKFITVEDLSSAIKNIYTLSSETIYHYINNISYLKPASEHALNLSITIYNEPAMSNAVGSFDSASSDCSSYIEALLINSNVSVISEETIDTETVASNTIAHTRWLPIDENISGEYGFGPQYNNAPVVVHLYDYMCNSEALSDFAATFNKKTILYLRNEWYYKTEEDGQSVYHMSDSYSQVVPSNTEQISEVSRIPELTSNLQPKIVVVDYLPVDEYNADDDGFYCVKTNQINLLSAGIDNSFSRIYLADYAPGNEYKIKFAAKTNIAVDNSSAMPAIQIAGNGEFIEDFENDGTAFSSGKIYMIAIQAGMIQKLAEKQLNN